VFFFCWSFYTLYIESKFKRACHKIRKFKKNTCIIKVLIYITKGCTSQQIIIFIVVFFTFCVFYYKNRAWTEGNIPSTQVLYIYSLACNFFNYYYLKTWNYLFVWTNQHRRRCKQMSRALFNGGWRDQQPVSAPLTPFCI